jgi:helix-turn-helix protein
MVPRGAVLGAAGWWEARVSIGEALVQARQRAGLSVAQVSERTRIRETIIRGIEDDDYSACGGDFYARGHIRAIAKVVGTDSEPLIREYDTRHRAPGVVAAVSLEELVATSPQDPQRYRPDLRAVWQMVAGTCVSAWRWLNLPAAWRAVAAAWVSAWRQINLPGVRKLAAQDRRSWARGVNWTAVREVTASAYAATRRKVNLPARARWVNWAAVLGLALVVVLSFGVYRLLAGSPQAVVAPSAASKHAMSHHHGQHSWPNPATKTSHAAVAPASAPAAPAVPLTPIHAAAFGPGGGDNPQLAHLAIGGHHAAGWHTDWYTSARFGNLYPGTGLLLDMGRPVTVTAARITLGSARGASLQLRVGAVPALTAMPPAAHISGTGGVVRLRLTRPAQGRYVLVWFTRLPADRAGTFQAGVYNVSLQGHP